MSSEKGLYRFFWDCGRMGVVESAFVATHEDVKNLIGKDIYFGEILGKHSEIYGVAEESDFTMVTDNEEAVKALDGMSFGHNPFDYISEDIEEN